MGIAKLCRLCAKEKDKCIDIYTEEGQKLKLSFKISQCLQIKVLPGDALPTLVCLHCCGKLNQSADFFEKSALAQVLLKKKFNAQIQGQQSTSKGENALCKSSDKFRYGPTENQLCIKEEDGNDVPSSDSETAAIIAPASSHDAPENENTPTNDTAPPSSSVTPRIEKPLQRVRLEANYEWHCTDCTMVLPNPQILKEHHRLVHKQLVRYQCVECAKVYMVYQKFTRHVRLHRNRNRFSCDQCKKTFSTKQALSNHAVLHSDARPFACEECGKTFRQVGSLYCHRRLHKPDEGKFPCPDCNKRLLSRQALEYHQKMHTGARDYTCDVCGRSFTVKQALAYHMMSHSGERPYTCQTCSKTFKTLYLLKKHSTVHSGVKAHQCDVCGKQFRAHQTLKQHGRIHTGSMPYKCEFCDRRFRFQGVYVIHRRQHTGERPYNCAECQHDFTNWANYNKHMKCRHGATKGRKRDVSVVRTQAPASTVPPVVSTEAPPTSVPSQSSGYYFVPSEPQQLLPETETFAAVFQSSVFNH